jgi:DNA polymerase-3 subunit gamma/tau
MIDEVHMLTNTAFNAMLKTLEEPPEYLKFVLATTDPQKVPVTVLSRCLQFNLRPMAPETICEHLQHVLSLESVDAEVQALRLLARAARGSMRDALSLTDQAIAFGSGQLQETAVRQMLGSVDRSYVFRLIEALALGDGKSVVETTEALRINGLSAASTLEEMSGLLHRMAVLQLAEPGNQDDTDPDSAEITRLSSLMPADETQLLYSICLHGRADLGLAPDEYAALTMVLLRLLAFKSPESQKKTLAPAEPTPNRLPPGQKLPVRDSKPETPQAPQSAAELAEELVDGAVDDSTDGAADEVAPYDPESVPSPQEFAAARAALSVAAPRSDEVVAVPVRQQAENRVDAAAGQTQPVLIPTEEGAFWHATVQQLIGAQAISAMVRELALQSQLVARDTDQWLLRVERESLNQAGARDRLASALQAHGFAVRLAVEIGRVTDSPVRRNNAASEEKQLAAEKIIFDDPFVQAMMRDFGAKIVPGSIRPL